MNPFLVKLRLQSTSCLGVMWMLSPQNKPRKSIDLGYVILPSAIQMSQNILTIKDKFLPVTFEQDKAKLEESAIVFCLGFASCMSACFVFQNLLPVLHVYPCHRLLLFTAKVILLFSAFVPYIPFHSCIPPATTFCFFIHTHCHLSFANEPHSDISLFTISHLDINCLIYYGDLIVYITSKQIHTYYV